MTFLPNPDAPDNALLEPPTKDELFRSAICSLKAAEYRLKAFLPKGAVVNGLEYAEMKCCDAIFGERHDRMKVPPEKMTAAAWRQWVFIVAHNAVVDELRWQKRRIRTVSIFSENLAPLAPEPTWFDLHDREIIRKSLGELPPTARAMIEALFFDGLTKVDAAEQFGMSEATFHRRYKAAISLLHVIFQRLSKEFLTKCWSA